ncbi:MAG: hypothetical protein MZV64_09700 [Ignavibacteriales bacterium]|nr:hypothetical protein [Ignavibacteriales bacterium]
MSSVPTSRKAHPPTVSAGIAMCVPILKELAWPGQAGTTTAASASSGTWQGDGSTMTST